MGMQFLEKAYETFCRQEKQALSELSAQRVMLLHQLQQQQQTRANIELAYREQAKAFVEVKDWLCDHYTAVENALQQHAEALEARQLVLQARAEDLGFDVSKLCDEISATNTLFQQKTSQQADLQEEYAAQRQLQQVLQQQVEALFHCPVAEITSALCEAKTIEIKHNLGNLQQAITDKQQQCTQVEAKLSKKKTALIKFSQVQTIRQRMLM